MAYLTEQLVPRHIGSTLSEFMLEMCPAFNDTSAYTTAPLADSGINDQLVKLRPLVDQTTQTCFEFLEVSYYPGVVNLLLQQNPDAVVDRVKVRRIRWPQCWRNKVRRISLQESDGVASSMTTPSTRSIDPVRSIFAKKLSKPRLVQFFGRRFCKKMNIT